ncbi:hypothetical protein E4U45_004795 [Claviceps purpurea]|nr:hypothetical protein E4U45_004795 [Claviceps purpurea]
MSQIAGPGTRAHDQATRQGSLVAIVCKGVPKSHSAPSLHFADEGLHPESGLRSPQTTDKRVGHVTHKGRMDERICHIAERWNDPVMSHAARG